MSNVQKSKARVYTMTLDIGLSTLDSELAGPTGLEPAHVGLRGRALPLDLRTNKTVQGPSVHADFGPWTFGHWTCFGCGGGIRTPDRRINNALPYQLGHATA
jgi:hypothetical protein